MLPHCGRDDYIAATERMGPQHSDSHPAAPIFGTQGRTWVGGHGGALKVRETCWHDPLEPRSLAESNLESTPCMMMVLRIWVSADLHSVRVVRIAQRIVFAARAFNYSGDVPSFGRRTLFS